MIKKAATRNHEIIAKAEEETTIIKEYFKNKPYAPLLWSSPNDASSFVASRNIQAVLFDCDGVLYRTPDTIPNAGQCVKNLMKAGKKVLFVTNNAGVNRQQLLAKLSSILGITGLSEEQMVSSSYSSARYLESVLANTRKRVHVIGSSGLCQELSSFGFTVSGGPSEERAGMDRQELVEYVLPEDPIEAFVVGHDTNFTFRKLCVANMLIQKNPGAILVATNRDSFDLVGSKGRSIPGNGCVVAALECCSGRKAINVGKPSAELLAVIKRDHDLDMNRTIFVGDRLDTDIKFAQVNNMFSVLVMTGVTSSAKLIELGEGSEEEPLPSAILSHVGNMML